MIQENEDLLLKDLCARLPYDVKIYAKCFDPNTNTDVEKVGVLSMVDNDAVIAFACDDTNTYNYVTIHDVKPYLFPLSSMTEEQKSFFKDKHIEVDDYLGIIALFSHIDCKEWDEVFCWLNENHFDYRGLIEKGLAIDATGLNIY